jgi:hypothetical protein
VSYCCTRTSTTVTATLKDRAISHPVAEYARDEVSEGIHELHINALEGLLVLDALMARPHRGTSQAKLSRYLGFVEFVRNACRGGKIFLDALFAVFVTS